MFELSRLRPFRLVCVGLLFLSLTFAPITVLAGRPVPSASVQPLQVNGQTFCTSFSINEAEGLWAAARHCADVAIEQDWTFTVNGRLAFVIYRDEMVDVAIIQADRHAPALELSSRVPRIGDAVTIHGYPYGISRLASTYGKLAARFLPLRHPTMHVMQMNDLYDITIAGGNSGSPVLNDRGEVIGLAWGGFVDSPYAIGVPLEALRRVERAFSAQ